VVAAPGVGNRPVVPSQGKHVKVIVAQDYMPNSFHFIVGVPLTGCVFVLCVNGNVPKKGIFFVYFDRVEFTYLGNKLYLYVSVKGIFYKTKKEGYFIFFLKFSYM
jgi:hypothetical protein